MLASEGFFLTTLSTHLDFFLSEIQVASLRESQQSRVSVCFLFCFSFVCFRLFAALIVCLFLSVSKINITLTWTTRSLTCNCDLFACVYTQGAGELDL